MDGPAPKEQMSQTERSGAGVLPPRPDLSPERKPEPLAKTFTKLREQLSAISMQPSKEQVSAVARKIQEEDKDVSLENARKRARRRFETYIRYQDKYLGANEGVALSRSRAFDAPAGEFETRRQTYHESIRSRNEARQALSGMANWLRGAGLQLEPGQRPLTLHERAQKRAAEAGWGMAATEYKTEQAVKKGVESLGRGAQETWVGAIEGGRNTIKSVVEEGNKGVQQAIATKDAAWNGLVNLVSSGYQKVGEDVKRSFVGGVWREVKQTFAGGRENIQEVGESLPELRADIRSFVGNSWTGFKSSMQALGEKAGSIKDVVAQSVGSFVSEQVNRVVGLEKEVQSRVSNELNKVVRGGKEFLQPAWESVEKDRQRIRAETNVLFDKLGLIVDSLGEKADPIVEPILDQGRDLRDSAFGWAKKGIEGMRAFGRKASGVASESPAWRFLAERFESLRESANSARMRLNSFLDQHNAPGPRLVFNEGDTVPMPKVEMFPGLGKVAREFFEGTKERVAKGFEALRRYWEIYAVGKWQEQGMSKVDITQRLVFMRAISAASLGRVASVSAAGALEGAALAGKLVRDPRGRLLLGAAAIAFALASNPDLVNHISSFFQNVDLSGLPQIDLPQVSLPNIGQVSGAGPTQAPEVPSMTLPEAQVTQTTAPTVSFPEAGVTQPVVAPLTQVPAPEVVTSGSQVGPGMETAAPVVPTTPEVQATPTTIPVVEAVASPVTAPSIPEATWSQIRIGEPIERQILDLAQSGQLGNATEAFNSLYKETFVRFGDNFLTTAQAMLRGEGGPYTSQQLAEAQAQVDAINQLRANPNIDPSTQDGLSLLRRAMHYWRPV